ncbi:MAG: hypothetical protein ACMZ7B_08475 [Balneola sp.]
MRTLKSAILLALISAYTFPVIAHPGGNMISVNGLLIWQYVYPPDARSHYSSVFMWDRIHGVRELMRSEFNSSDFHFYAIGDTVYYAEFSDVTNGSRFRLLKGLAGEVPVEIWGWQDALEFGSAGGFYIADETEIIFAKYPSLYSINKAGNISLVHEFEEPVSGVTMTEAGLLVNSPTEVRLVDEDYSILKTWNNLINPDQENLPFMGNRIFSADYNGKELLVAYWGGRSFFKINEQGKKETLLELPDTYTAHWAVLDDEEYFLFGSQINPPDPIKPLLYYHYKGENAVLWGDN